MKRSIIMTILVLVLFTFNSIAHAKMTYDKVTVPGAYCGNGKPYHVFINKNSEQDEKILFYLESGGACWSFSTCWGPNLRAWVHRLWKPRINLEKFKNRNIFTKHTSIIFPYCTGDIFGANHKAKYGIKHVGKKNIEVTLDYLRTEGIINYDNFNNLTVSGSSAGAIGGMINANLIENQFPNLKHRNLIMDSPGMHWGKEFWNKFNKKLLDEFSRSTAHILNGLFDHGGEVIHHLPQICSHFYNWNVGILQSTKDIIMSGVFGNISPKKHKDIVYGPNGLYNQSLNINNCAAWSPDSFGHAYLQLDPLKGVKAGNMDSIGFVNRILNGHTQTSYRD